MYGFGSKKSLIEDFASTALTEYSVVVINGYLQTINLKQVSSAQINSKAIYMLILLVALCTAVSIDQ